MALSTLSALSRYWSGKKTWVDERIADTSFTDGEKIVVHNSRYDKKGIPAEISVGFLAHESAHCRYSDFSAIQKADDNFERNLINVLEDIRVERLISLAYPRAYLSLDKAIRFMVESGNISYQKSLPLNAAALQFILLTLRFSILGNSICQDSAEKSAADMKKRFKKQYNSISGILENIGREMKTTGDVVSLTKSISKILNDPQEKSSPKTQREINKENSYYDQLAKTINAIQPQASGYQDTQANGYQATQASGYQDNCRHDSKISGNAFTATGKNPGTGKANDLPANLAQSYDTDSENTFSLNDRVLTEAAQKICDCNYEQFGRYVHYSARLKTIFENLLGSENENERDAGTSGRLWGKKIQKVNFNDPKIYRKRSNDDLSRDMDIHLLCDISGSMARLLKSRQKSNYCGIVRRARWIDAAEAAVWTVSDALEKIEGITRSVSFFPGFDQPVMELLGKDESARKNFKKFAQAPHGNTPTDQALAHAIKKLMQSSARRKLIIIVTDGCPENEVNTKAACQIAKKAGIEIFAIGMGGDFVKRIFDDCSVVQVDDMGSVLNELVRVLKKKLKR